MTKSAGPEEFACEEHEYDHALDRGLRVSGEARDFFARSRATFLAERLRRIGERPGSVLDFGCGSGGSSRILRDVLDAPEMVGVDVSERLLQSARTKYESAGLRFASPHQLTVETKFDLAFCNGVFHHIAPHERAAAVRYVREALRPGGLLALWENNPWSPAARYVMSRIPFDQNAVMVWPKGIRRLLTQEGFDILSTDFCFVFPRSLKLLRPLEPWMIRLPLGAQYQILARKSEP